MTPRCRTRCGFSFRTRPHPDSPDGEGWLIAWDQELDVRTVADRGPDAVTGLAVASYLAKYATKGTEVSGHASARITRDNLDLYAHPAGTHTERLIDACRFIGHAQGRMRGKVTYSSLRRWATCSASAVSYAGTGWRTFGDVLLANTAADQARKRRETARSEIFGGDFSESARRAA